ncbi:hypothetical protein ACFQI7_04605 [Paenibacillus allorhizosphaerae]|uniref:Lipoprotein n=1 Tax=Paenibacillus allorhizosphaerae TaxID=2849866 RepID=A0ABM8VCG3_9BACL|nr:hypothetical protein [Paenibacillus allorhizosphaerae]CAG7623090.1 hypothetical protein PAECIP111802_00904 [Paenibacillus allorhizosphaerae]
MEQFNNGGTTRQPTQRPLSTRKAVKLFLASTLILGSAAGCSSNKDCIDQNQDGYCDNGGGRSGSGSGYYGSGGGSSKSGSSTGVSSGSHGGIGSSGISSS